MSKISKIRDIKRIKDTSFGFLFDKIISTVINLVTPVKVPPIVISQIRTPIIGCLGTSILLSMLFLILMSVIMFSPMLLGAGVFNSLTSIFTGTNILNIPVDKSFSSTFIPKKNPLGGSGMDYTSVTAYYMDTNYFLQFGKSHSGIDLVPSSSYYKNSKTYKDFKQIVIYSTINGTARHYVDQYGGETVEVTNKNNSLKVTFIHFSTVLVESGEVTAGTPLGIMGDTGNATGVHVHYEIKTKDGDNWLSVNPVGYIK